MIYINNTFNIIECLFHFLLLLDFERSFSQLIAVKFNRSWNPNWNTVNRSTKYWWNFRKCSFSRWEVQKSIRKFDSVFLFFQDSRTETKRNLFRWILSNECWLKSPFLVMWASFLFHFNHFCDVRNGLEMCSFDLFYLLQKGNIE